MMATGRLISNGLAAEGAKPGRGSRLGFFLLMQLGDQLHKSKDADGNKQKVDHGLDKGAVVQRGNARFLGGLNGGKFAFAQGHKEAGSVHAAGYQRENGHKHVIHQRSDDLAESATNHNADSHINHIALERKLFEFTQ